MEYPSVLVISHNPFSNSQNNGKTLSAFFDGWPKDKIAQLYLSPDIPDFTICDKFYRITDLDVLKQFLKRGNAGSEINKKNIIINEKEILHNNKAYMFIRNLAVKRLPIMNWARNIIWKHAKPWKNINLNNWIQKFNPDVIFFQSSNMYSIFDMVDEICKKFSAKLFTETTDDYVTKKFSMDPFYIHDITKMIERYRNVVVDKSECIFSIGDAMAEEYKKRFGGTYKVAMNSIDVSNEVIDYDKIHNDEIILTYTGNLGLNRWKILCKIGNTIEELKKRNNINARLNIYSLDIPNERVLKKLNSSNAMNFKGKLNREQLIKVRNESDILVHVESFDRKSRHITRLSVSTKIPEYLISKRCILAVGPKDVASIKYIQDNKIGMVITNIKGQEFKEKLKQIILNRKERNIYIINGNKIAEERHSFKKNRDEVQQELLKSINKI